MEIKSQDVVVLGMTIDDKLSLKTHIQNISRTVKCNFHALRKHEKVFNSR